jgi:hypothetical protein
MRQQHLVSQRARRATLLISEKRKCIKTKGSFSLSSFVTDVSPISGAEATSCLIPKLTEIVEAAMNRISTGHL